MGQHEHASRTNRTYLFELEMQLENALRRVSRWL